MQSISAQCLKPLLTDGKEIAFLDVREHGQYGEGHPFFSVSLPYSRLENLAPGLLPCQSVRIVLMDDGDGVAARAARRFATMGYDNVSILDGGAAAWAAAGYTLFKGVNVPSKSFGEMLEHEAHTPKLTAADLHALLARDSSVVVLDGRTAAEYEKMALPGALCCPNAELGYRLRSLVADESTTIVVNCAGRTRSIVGTEGLRTLGTKNPVYALENGTQGWRLAGFELAHGVSAQRLPEPTAKQLASMAALAERVIADYGLASVSPETVAEWQQDDRRTTYLLDVRTEEEFVASHWPGSRHAAGGQLVQATDQYVAVRNARIVLCDDVHLRAATTAIWLRSMGHDVYILDADVRAGNGSVGDVSHDRREELATGGDWVDCIDDCIDDHIRTHISDRIGDGATLLDASPGMSFRKAHIAGARWVTRARLDRSGIDLDEPVLVTGQDDVLLEGVVTDLKLMGYKDLTVFRGSPHLWSEAGLRLVASPNDPPEHECIDYLFFVHDRHDGNLDAARRYLDWELGLLDQLDAQERAVLNPSRGH